ncbi:MAG: insulinase family protein [Gammaproteobacteria bacterium]|nr:insulinase family protein [Gammaproteobacteria bacterium]
MTETKQLAHPEFTHIRNHAIPSLNIEVQEFEHIGTGARHIHMATDDDQNTFLVGFKTVPQDSTGVAHILEHTSLCGSKKFPVRDPFFMMTRRSLNTFMNAFTSSDWTAYPFASRNRKDYDNLLQVYLDAVFFPSLNELDFAQEGHRVEFKETENSDSDLVFKGVVFNEMKGAMSSPVSTLWQELTTELFPTVTYHFNSGGEPANIPDLSYEELKAFHADHYHPSNALFMTYGDIPARELQAEFHEQALSQFEKRDLNINVPDEQRFSAPKEVVEHYALDGEESLEHKTHIVLGWLLGRCTDAEEVMTAHLLSGILMESSASPLRHVLETTDLGQAPSPLCGVSDSSREMIFACGLEGSDPDKSKAVEKLILDTLERIATDGVPQEMVEAVLHQLELSQREVSGDGFPYGLQLIVHTLGGNLHGADPVALLDLDPILEKLRQQIADPEFVKGLVRDLLNNRHRVLLTMSPDRELSAKRDEAESKRLAEMKAKLSEAEKKAIIEKSLKLAERQEQADDPELLPKVGLEDIPAELTLPIGEESKIANQPATWFSRGTNGLVYQQLVIDLPDFTPEQRQLLPMFSDVITEVGYGNRDYLETQELITATTGGIGASVSVRGSIDDLNSYKGTFAFSGKALTRNSAALTELLEESFSAARFDELERIRELISQERMGQEQRVTGSGHSLAMAAAASNITAVNQLNHQWGGLEGIQFIKGLDDGLNEQSRLEALSEQFAEMRDKIVKAPRQFLTIGEAELKDSIMGSIDKRWAGSVAATELSPIVLPQPEGMINQGWATSTQVNFCARAYPTIPSTHADTPALMVLAGFLRNNFLHRAIREQGGAYGGGASFDNDSGSFRFFSYRDPRLAETLQDFDNSIEWLLGKSHPWREVEEAILGVIGSIDKPGSPAGEAKSTFHASRHGRTPEFRNRFRQKILKVTEADLKRVAETYLKPERAHTAVISDPATLEKSDLGLEIINL